MNVEYFISKKLFNTKEKNNSYTAPIFRIAILSIALSVSVMLISVMVVTGFKNEIASKIIGFGSHIIINKFSNNESYESEPIDFNKEFYLSINNDESIKNINVFATKAAVLKNNDEIHGVVLKGLSYDYDWSFFNEHLVDGEVLDLDENEISNNVLISDKVAHILVFLCGSPNVLLGVLAGPKPQASQSVTLTFNNTKTDVMESEFLTWAGDSAALKQY